MGRGNREMVTFYIDFFQLAIFLNKIFLVNL